ncbi:hypothetical protein MASR1M8_25480 [Thermomonas brevis]
MEGYGSAVKLYGWPLAPVFGAGVLAQPAATAAASAAIIHRFVIAFPDAWREARTLARPPPPALHDRGHAPWENRRESEAAEPG